MIVVHGHVATHWDWQGVKKAAGSEFTLQRIVDTVSLSDRLEARTAVPVPEFTNAMLLREAVRIRSSEHTLGCMMHATTLTPDTCVSGVCC